MEVRGGEISGEERSLRDQDEKGSGSERSGEKWRGEGRCEEERREVTEVGLILA